jgi:hypothetical protein
VTKLNASGNGLAYSTYLGGAGNNATSTPSAHGDVSQAIAINSSGNAYVTGYTWSANFPTTTGAFQTAFKGSASISNAFVTQLNSTGTALAYSTYLGGSGSNGAGDYGNAIAVDASGDAFVAGSTASGDFPASSAAFQTSLHGTSNAFVTELNPAGAGEVYSTFLGGSGADSAQAIAVDTSGHAYVGGRTSSTDFPTSASAMEGAGVSNDGIFAQWGLNAFAAKLSPNGSSLVYSTFIEGASASIAGLAIDSAGNLYLAGSTTPAGSGSSGYFQPTADALPAPAGGNSAFVVKLDPAGATFSFASLLGGSGNDVANALALDAGGNVYVTGAALSTDFPTSSSALQTANKAKFANGSNAFISKFALAGEASGLVYSISAPSYLIPTSLEGGVQASTPYCASDYSADSEPAYGFFDLVSSLPGPPVQGIFGYSSQLDVTYYAPAGGVDYFSVEDGFPYDLPATGGSATFGYGAYFLGDGVYAPSSTSGSFTITFCPPPTDSSASSSRKSLLRATRKTAPLAALPGALRKQAAKFLPLPDLFPAARPGALPTPANSTPSCTAPLTPLTVVLRPAARTYGAANPAFSYTISGLRNGDTVSVEPFTTATPASSAGAYPIEADVAGPDAANYAITVNGSTLDVSKAPLYIAARNIDMTYGQTPPSPAGMYTITGFVNGDTQASATSGAPALSTTVTSTSPVGFYPITVGVGTLSATNYFFSDFASGEGKLGVYKAPLVIHPASVTILQGATWQNVPYEITGFANGETQTSATTGAPAFTTNAPSTSVPGRYYIIANVGTLAAQNYYFTNPSPATDGILTILK